MRDNEGNDQDRMTLENFIRAYGPVTTTRDGDNFRIDTAPATDAALAELAALRADRDEWKRKCEYLQAKYDVDFREPGCQCQLEAGDSPCRVHGEEK